MRLHAFGFWVPGQVNFPMLSQNCVLHVSVVGGGSRHTLVRTALIAWSFDILAARAYQYANVRSPNLIAYNLL